MLKVFPIIFIISFFFIIFINVKNLTAIKDSEIENFAVREEIIKEQGSKIPSIEINKKEEEIIDQEESFKDDKETSSLSMKNKIKNTKPPEKKKMQSDSASNIVNNEKLIKVQFGAFSKLKNAENQKTFIEKTISKKFSFFLNNLKILNENKLYKLIFFSKTIEMAKSICEYSKINEISCLILNDEKL